MRLGLRITAIVLLALLAPALSVGADDVRPNAAALYQKIWDTEQGEYVDSRALGDEFEDIDTDGWAPGPVITEALNDPERMERIRTAARDETFDLDLDYAEGPGLGIPHVTPMRNAARLLLAEARLRFDAGEIDAGTTSLVDAFAIIKHLREDKCMVTTLVGMSLVADACWVIEHVEHAQWTKESACRLLEATEFLTGPDPFNARRAILHDADALARWIERRCQTPEGIARMWDTIDSMVTLDGKDGAPPRFALGLEVVNAGGFKRCAELYRKTGDAQVELLEAEDYDAARARFIERVKSGEFGPFGRIFAPSIDRLREYNRMVSAHLPAIRGALDDVCRFR